MLKVHNVSKVGQHGGHQGHRGHQVYQDQDQNQRNIKNRFKFLSKISNINNPSIPSNHVKCFNACKLELEKYKNELELACQFKAGLNAWLAFRFKAGNKTGSNVCKNEQELACRFKSVIAIAIDKADKEQTCRFKAGNKTGLNVCKNKSHIIIYIKFHKSHINCKVKYNKTLYYLNYLNCCNISEQIKGILISKFPNNKKIKSSLKYHTCIWHC